jgi:hypothetical protein
VPATDAERETLYRSELERVVRPRRPAPEETEAPRPAATRRPPPLVLISEQRIDRPAEPAPAPAQVTPIRPRRMASSALAVSALAAEAPAAPEPVHEPLVLRLADTAAEASAEAAAAAVEDLAPEPAADTEAMPEMAAPVADQAETAEVQPVARAAIDPFPTEVEEDDRAEDIGEDEVGHEGADNVGDEDEVGDEDDDQDEDEDEDDGLPRGNVFAVKAEFAAFAARIGASEVDDLIEAAAVYATVVEGRPHVSRPEMLRQAEDALPDDAVVREDLLVGFGRLLRDGRIEKVRRGQFAAADGSRLMLAARKLRH